MTTGNRSHPLSRDEILSVLVTYAGTTTSNGAATFDSLIDSALIGTNPQAVTDKLVQIGSGPDIAQQCTAIAFNPVTGEVTFTPAASNQVMAGTTWKLVNIAGALSGGGTTPQNIVDAVYFDDILGVPGTSGTIGTPTNPVNNLPDALSLMATRKLNKMVLAGTGPHAIIFTGIVTDTQVIGNAEYDITVAGGFDASFDGDLLCQNLVNSGAGTVLIKGNLRATQNVINDGGGNIVVLGDLSINADTSTGAVTGTLDNTGGNKITVAGDAFVGGAVINPINCTMIFLGSLKQGFAGASGSFQNGGLMIIDGDYSMKAGPVTNTNILDINGNADFGNVGLTNTGVGRVIVYGNVTTGGTITNDTNATGQVYGSVTCQGLIHNSVNTLTINGNLQCFGDLDDNGTGELDITGDVWIGKSFLNNGAGIVKVSGNVEIHGDAGTGQGTLDNTGGALVEIRGNLTLTGLLQNAAGLIQVLGDCRAAAINNVGAGDVQIFGSFNGRQSPGGGPCGHILNSGTGNVQIHGDVNLNGDPNTPGGYIDNTGGSDILIFGNLFMTGNITNPTGTINVDGRSLVMGNITNGGNISFGPLECRNIALTVGAGSIVVDGDCRTQHIDCAAGVFFTVLGNCQAAAGLSNAGGNVTIQGNVIIGMTAPSSLENSAGGGVNIQGNCQVADHVKNLAGCTMSIAGKLDISGDPSVPEGYLDNTNATMLYVGNDCHLSGKIINTTGVMIVEGDLWCGDDAGNGAGIIGIAGAAYFVTTVTNGAGTIAVEGIARVTGVITNAGTFTYQVLNPEDTQYDHTHQPQQVAPDGAPAITLTSGAGVYTLGAFSTDIIVAAAIPNKFDIHGIDIEDPNANAEYQIQLYGTVGGVADTLVGKCTFTRTNATTVSRSTTMQTPKLDAGSRLRAKMMDSVGSKTCNVKVWFHEYP